MITIKEIAQKASVSPSTVSIIINGQEKERHISPETVQKVKEIMRQLGYTPNFYAGRLRAKKGKLVIAFFWPISHRASMLTPFLKGMQAEIKRRNIECELVVQNFENNRLYLFSEAIEKNRYNGIIIGATSIADNEYLESLDGFIPIVLFNRRSVKYSTLCTDNEQIAKTAVAAIKQSGSAKTALFIPVNPYIAADERSKYFIEHCKREGIELPSKFIIHTDDTLSGGAEAARRLMQLNELPDSLYCESDNIALGALHEFYQAGIKIPNDIKIIATGLMDPTFVDYSNPSLTTVDMDTESIASSIMDILLSNISNPDAQIVHRKVDCKLIYRDSLPKSKS